MWRCIALISLIHQNSMKDAKKINTMSSMGLFILFAVMLAFASTFMMQTVNADTTTTVSNPNGLGMYYVNVVPDSYFKTPGQYVTFSGSHFYPGELISIQRNGSVVASLAADSSGAFSDVTILQPYAWGTYAYTFTGAISGIPFTVNESVGGATPWVTLSNYYAGPGAQIVVMGHSFGANEQVTVWFDGINEGSSTADTNGNANLTITVPSNGVGQHTIVAKGSLTNISATQSFSEAW
ncbi:MAG: hypothetical protein JWO50_811 [Candidatus Kaiserbacteria bacterium]|nr:hypothetical protein [Candidatus Kaiserbacteria bacterium]